MKKTLTSALILLMIFITLAMYFSQPTLTGLSVANPPKNIEASAIREAQQNGKARVLVELNSSGNEKQKNSIISEMNKRGFTIRHRFGNSSFFSGEANPETLSALANDPNVNKVSLVRILKIDIDPSTPIIEADVAHEIHVNGVNITGAGQSVCVVDTGIDYRDTSFGNCTSAQVTSGTCSKVPSGFNYCADDSCSTSSSDPLDNNGHGTHVSGIVAANGSIQGIAPGANIIAIKALNSTGFGSDDDIAAGIDWCVTNSTKFNISVITMSLGVYLSDYTSATCPPGVIRTAIDNAYAKNIFVSVAAGNDGFTNGIAYPACSPNATSVGASTSTDGIASFSDTGPDLSVLAPGVGITSTWLGGDYSTATLSGTSMATPHVAAVAAMIQQYENLQNDRNATIAEIRNLLNRTNVTIFDSANGLTFPRIDAYLSLNSILTINQTQNSVKDRLLNGQIDFNTPTTLDNASQAIRIQHNLVSVDSADYPQFNNAANVTLYNLSFSATPVVYKDGALCTSGCEVINYTGGNFTFSVTGFSNYSSGVDANMTIWNQNDSMPYGNLGVFEGYQVYFYANYTNITSGASVDDTLGNCSISFSDFTGNFTFNTTKQLWQFNRTFASFGSYGYDVSCYSPTYETLNTSDTIYIYAATDVCDPPAPSVDWIVTKQKICNDKNIDLINQSLIVENASFLLNNSNISMGFTNSVYNFTIDENSSLVAYGSEISSSGNDFNIYVNGITNVTNTNLGNLIFLYLQNNKSNILSNINFTYNAYFKSFSNNTINASRFLLPAYFSDNSSNNIANTVFSNTTTFQKNSFNTLSNSTFNQLVIMLDNATTNFILPQSNISFKLQSFTTPTIYGYVDMPDNNVTVITGNLTRFYPVLVNYTSGPPYAGKQVNITDVLGNVLWQGTTDANGYIEPNMTFNSTSYNTVFNISTDPAGAIISQNISSFADTPIQFLINPTFLYISLNSPANQTQINNTQDYGFNFTALSSTSSTFACSVFLDGTLNQTNSSTENDTLTTFTIAGMSYGAHSWDVNCTDAAMTNVSDTWLFSIADTIPPAINNVSVYPNPVLYGNQTNITANITDNVAVDKVWISIDNGANITMTPTGNEIYYYDQFNTNATLGLHNFTVYANDTSNNLNFSSGNFTIVDTIPPNVSTNATPSPVNIGNNVTITANVTDNVNVSQVWVTVWNGLTAILTKLLSFVSGNTYSTNITTNESFATNTTYTVYANDTSGNNASVNGSFFVNRAPSATLIDPANNTQINDTQTVEFNFTAIDDLNATLNCSIYLDGLLNQTNSSTENDTLTGFSVSGISYGGHSWLVNCSDGVLSNASSAYLFSINDTIPPAIQFVSPTETSGTNIDRNYVQINVTSSDIHLLNTTIFVYNSTTKIRNATTSGTQEFLNLTGLPDGIYYFNATSYDSFGNSNSTETRNVTVSTPPVVSLVSPANNTLSYNAANTFTYNVSDDDNIFNCSLYFNGIINETSTSVSKNTAQSFSISGMQNGSYNWSVGCYDVGGTYGYYGVFNLTVLYYCGDGVVSNGEQCDGANLNGRTCVSLGYSGGTLSCTGSCTFNTGGCIYSSVPSGGSGGSSGGGGYGASPVYSLPNKTNSSDQTQQQSQQPNKQTVAAPQTNNNNQTQEQSSKPPAQQKPASVTNNSSNALNTGLLALAPWLLLALVTSFLFAMLPPKKVIVADEATISYLVTSGKIKNYRKLYVPVDVAMRHIGLKNLQAFDLAPKYEQRISELYAKHHTDIELTKMIIFASAYGKNKLRKSRVFTNKEIPEELKKEFSSIKFIDPQKEPQ